MKNNFIALFILVIVHIIYDWTIPFVPINAKPLFFSLWNLATYGYIFYRLVNDAINETSALNRNALFTLSLFFMYRSILNTAAFIRSLRFDENTYDAYKDITSNYVGDVFIWSIIGLILVKLYWKHIFKLCQRHKTT